MQGSNISSDQKNNIVAQTMGEDIILDHQIKTCNSWLARVEFHQKISSKGAQVAKSSGQQQ